MQVSRKWQIIDPIPKDLNIKPWPEAHFDVQARLVHQFFDPAGQIHLEEAGLALIPGVDEFEIVK